MGIGFERIRAFVKTWGIARKGRRGGV